METHKFTTNNHKINLGIETLRMILCFWVITFHFAGNSNKIKYKILQTFYHVPTFMLISFYFSYKAFISNDIIKYKMRLERLLIPYIIWPIIFLSISISFDSINIKKLIYELLLQYITGYKISIHLWFIQILIFFEIFFQIINFLFKKQSLFILQIFSIISYFIQYKEINYKIFFHYSPHLRSVSHIAEMIPIAVTGLTLRNIDIFKSLSINKKKSIFFSMISLYFIYNYNVFGQFKGFPYSGINNNIAGICLFNSFFLIPFDTLKNKIIIVCIKVITRYTGGIYYLQIITLFLDVIHHILTFFNYDYFKNFVVDEYNYFLNSVLL
jgi:hypothetical protein